MHQFKHYLVIFACNIFLVMPDAARQQSVFLESQSKLRLW